MDGDYGNGDENGLDLVRNSGLKAPKPRPLVNIMVCNLLF